MASYSAFKDVATLASGTATAPESGANVTGDPLFTDEVGGDFTLQTGSPAIDRGDASLVSPGELDLAGNARSQAFFLACIAAPDMGAYEKTGAPAACPPSPGSAQPGGPASDPTLVIAKRAVRLGSAAFSLTQGTSAAVKVRLSRRNVALRPPTAKRKHKR